MILDLCFYDYYLIYIVVIQFQHRKGLPSSSSPTPNYTDEENLLPLLQ